MIQTTASTSGSPVSVVDMSGGNQQSCVLGKWLARDLKLFICDEPILGVDVGAKEEIYGIIQKL